MDPFTHALSGAVIRQIGFKRKAALLVLLLSSVAPDLDYITRIWGIDVFLRYHRGITHGILALFAFPLLMGIIFRKKGGFFYYYFISFLGYATHLFFDLTNQYGTRILAPLDWSQYSLDLTFIIDPYITISLLLCVIMGRINKKKASLIAVCTVIFFAGYVGSRAYFKDSMTDFLKTRVDANIYKVYPLPNDFLSWWFIVKSGNEVTAGFADLFTKRVCIQEKFILDNSHPAIEKSRQTTFIKNFLYFARYPHAEVINSEKGITVIWRELSYSFLSGNRFTARVVMDKQGNVIESKFNF